MGAVQLRWLEQKVFVGTDSNGHSIVIGRTDQAEHPWDGMKPSDLLLIAVASCSVFDVVEILTKQREPFTDLKVECTGEQLENPPYTFTKIHIHYLVKGAVNPLKLEKSIRISEDKYCCVINSLRPTVEFVSDYEIVES